ncbi:MAG: hypothetical protein LH609_16240 [Rudanella sp.]|nr:hypothetical protein [Rudanella sp.]
MWTGTGCRYEAMVCPLRQSDWMARSYGEVSNPSIPGRSAAAGEACVSALAHDTQEVVQQAYYNGTKETGLPERTDVAQRGHGRIDQRSYRCFKLAGCALAPRWKDAGLNTLIIVKRSRQGLDGSLQSEEVTGPPVRLFFE